MEKIKKIKKKRMINLLCHQANTHTHTKERPSTHTHTHTQTDRQTDKHLLIIIYVLSSQTPLHSENKQRK